MGKLYNYLGAIMRRIGLQNVIIIEAERIQRENTAAVFKEMLRRGWNNRCRIILVSDDPKSIQCWKEKKVSVVKRVHYGDNWVALLQMRWWRLRTCLIIDENLQKTSKADSKTLHVFLTHGSPVKRVHDYYNCSPDTDYVLCQSDFWKSINAFELKIPLEKLVIKGFPRNDALFASKVRMSDLFGREYKKVVAWYPTFRQRTDILCPQNTKSSALPIVHDSATAKQINEIAAQYDVLLVVKPHPTQDLSQIKALELDHLKLIYDDFFVKHKISPYAFLGKTDALITDYSSVIFDYLLTGRPIALAQEDYEEYEKKVGFAIDMDLLRSCAVRLENVKDFEIFFCDLIAVNDPFREKRNELMHLTNHYVDGNSTQRVVDWLETLLNKH